MVGSDFLLITRETDYALRILRALYQKGQMSASAIAQREHISRPVTLKIVKQLHGAGLLESRRGPSGGYLLREGCEQMSLWDVFQALDDSILLNRCQQDGYQCENLASGECGISRELSRVQQVLDRELKKTPLSVLFQKKRSVGRPKNS